MAKKNGFGKPSKGDGVNYENWRLKEDESITVGIFPPMGSGQETGRWSLYYGIHFGWKGRNKKDPTKLRHRPFLSLEETKWEDGNRVTVFQSAADELIKSMVDKKDALKAKLMSEGKDEKEANKHPEMKKIFTWLKNHNVDRKHHFACVNKNGDKLGFLAVPHKVMQGLKALRDELEQEGYDIIPTDGFNSKGVYVTISRRGSGFNTEYSVRAATETIETDNGKMKKIQEWTLTEDLGNRALNLLPDLEEQRDRIKISPAAIQELVDCGGDPDEVDRIMDKALGKKTEKSEKASSEDAPKPKKEKSAPKPEPVAEEEDEEDEEAALLKRLAALKAKKAAKAEEKSAEPEPETDGDNEDDEDDDDMAFLDDDDMAF